MTLWAYSVVLREFFALDPKQWTYVSSNPLPISMIVVSHH